MAVTSSWDRAIWSTCLGLARSCFWNGSLGFTGAKLASAKVRPVRCWYVWTFTVLYLTPRSFCLFDPNKLDSPGMKPSHPSTRMGRINTRTAAETNIHNFLLLFLLLLANDAGAVEVVCAMAILSINPLRVETKDYKNFTTNWPMALFTSAMALGKD